MKLPKKANDPPPATLGAGVGGGDDGKGVVEVEEGGTAEPSSDPDVDDHSAVGRKKGRN